MMLIADSGGTSTRWICVLQDKIIRVEGIGLNPNAVRHTIIRKELIRVRSLLPEIPTRILFYGAGCGKPAGKKFLKQLLSACFQCRKVRVETDLTGAGLGMFGNKKGIACILGTGSNAGRFNGKRIVNSVTSRGYKKGDQGSAAWIGKRLPKKMQPKKRIKGRPAAQYGSLAMIAFKNMKDPTIREMVLNGFREYVRCFILPLKPSRNEVLCFTGGVAWNFRKQLTGIVREFVPNEIRYYKEYIPGLLEHHVQSSN